MNDSPVIAVVDDDDAMRESLKALLRSAGLRAEVFASGMDFLESGVLERVDCLVLDVDMPGMSGPELQQVLNERGCRVPIVFITGKPDGDLEARLLAAGARAFFGKPFDEEGLLKDIETAARGPDTL